MAVLHRLGINIMALTNAERGFLVGGLNAKIPNAATVSGRKRPVPKVIESIPGKGDVFYGSIILQIGVNNDREIKWIQHTDPNDNVTEVFFQGGQPNADNFGVKAGWSTYNQDSSNPSSLIAT